MSVNIVADRPPPRPAIVLFDLDDTLYDYAVCNNPALAAALNYIANRFNLACAKAEQAFDLARAEVKAQLGDVAASHSRLLYFHKTIELIGVGSQPEEALRLEQIFWRVYLSRMELSPGVEDLLVFLRSCGVRMGVVTDLTAQIQFRKLLALRVASFFDAVVCSEEVGSEKSSGAPYLAMARKLAWKPDDVVWMIGDSIVDIASAQTAIGAKTLHYAKRGPLVDHFADVSFTSFVSLGAQVRRWINA